MNSKSIIALTFIFAFQFLMSCGLCGCGDSVTYEVEYDEIVEDLKQLYLSAMNQNRTIDESLYKASVQRWQSL